MEITDSIIVFCDKYVIFVASPKKLQFFKQVRELFVCKAIFKIICGID